MLAFPRSIRAGDPSVSASSGQRSLKCLLLVRAMGTLEKLMSMLLPAPKIVRNLLVRRRAVQRGMETQQQESRLRWKQEVQQDSLGHLLASNLALSMCQPTCELAFFLSVSLPYFLPPHFPSLFLLSLLAPSCGRYL